MQYPNIDYMLFRKEDSNHLIQIILTTKKDNWSYFMILEPSERGEMDLELFAKFRLNDTLKTNGFMRYHLFDAKTGWQGKIEEDKVEKGVIEFFDYNAIYELTLADIEAYNELHKALYQLVSRQPELPDGYFVIDEQFMKLMENELVVLNDELMKLMKDDFIWKTDNWPWSDKNGLIPDEFALYYLDNWHGRIITDNKL